MSGGLGAAERAAYELLLESPPATLKDVAAQWDRPEDPTHALARLEAAGLISALPGDPPRYQATAADVLLETFIAEGEAKLARAQERAVRLAAAYRQARSGSRSARGDVVEVVTGQGEIALRLNRLHRSARREVCCLDARPDPGLAAMLKPGVAFRCIYSRAAVGEPEALPEIESLLALGQQARVLPGVPLRLHLADDKQAILPVRDDPAYHAAIVVYPSALLGALHKLFEAMWHRAVPLRISAPQPRVPARRVGDVESDHLIGLLLSGLTDEAIARHLGAGYRTVQRRVATLMAELGAHSRFQAGVMAAIRPNRSAP